MAKVHKTLRLEEGLADRAKAAQRPGESEAATLARLIEAGLDSLEGTQGGSGDSALVAALEANIADLRQQVAIKDGQIEALQGITKAAQALHGASEVAHVKSLEDGKQPGRWARAWAAITGRDSQD